MVRDEIEVRSNVDAPVDVVWRFLTSERDAWWPEMQFDAAVGASLVETWTEEGRLMTATGSVVQCGPPLHLVFRWRQPTWRGDLEVSIRLESWDAGTVITLVESGFAHAETPPTLPAEHEEGWSFHLERWKRASEEAVDRAG